MGRTPTKLVKNFGLTTGNALPRSTRLRPRLSYVTTPNFPRFPLRPSQLLSVLQGMCPEASDVVLEYLPSSALPDTEAEHRSLSRAHNSLDALPLPFFHRIRFIVTFAYSATDPDVTPPDALAPDTKEGDRGPDAQLTFESRYQITPLPVRSQLYPE